MVKTIGLILFTAGKHEERNRDIRKHLITVGSLVIAVLGSWYYLVTIINFLGFIASQSKKKRS